MDISNMIVAFHAYCPSCKHWKKEENEHPCRICLTSPAREGSLRPEKYESAKGKSHKI